MSIAVNGAANIGVRTFIRVGSINCGDVIISSATVRLDYTSNCYIPEYPAAVNYAVLLALIEAAENLAISNYHGGVAATTVDFYAGQNRPNRLDGTLEMANLLPTLQKARMLNLEMEAPTLYRLASSYGLRAGAVLAVFNSQLTGEFKADTGEENAIKIVNEATKTLSGWDAEKRESNKCHLFPSLLKSK